MGISYSPGDSIGIKPELEKGRKEAAEQHIVPSKLVFLAMLAAGLFAILSGLSSAYFTKFFDKYPDWVNIGGIVIAVALVIIFIGVYRIKKK